MSLFQNKFHNDPTVTGIEKFNHLISCLSEEALDTIKAIFFILLNLSEEINDVF